MFPSFAAIVLLALVNPISSLEHFLSLRKLLALVNPISSLEHFLSLRNSSFEQNGIASGSRLAVHGGFDQNGLDSGIPSNMKEAGDGLWQYDLMTELPSFFQVHIQRADKNSSFDFYREPGDLPNLSAFSNLSFQ